MIKKSQRKYDIIGKLSLHFTSLRWILLYYSIYIFSSSSWLPSLLLTFHSWRYTWACYVMHVNTWTNTQRIMTVKSLIFLTLDYLPREALLNSGSNRVLPICFISALCAKNLVWCKAQEGDGLRRDLFSRNVSFIKGCKINIHRYREGPRHGVLGPWSGVEMEKRKTYRQMSVQWIWDQVRFSKATDMSWTFSVFTR